MKRYSPSAQNYIFLNIHCVYLPPVLKFNPRRSDNFAFGCRLLRCDDTTHQSIAQDPKVRPISIRQIRCLLYVNHISVIRVLEFYRHRVGTSRSLWVKRTDSHIRSDWLRLRHSAPMHNQKQELSHISIHLEFAVHQCTTRRKKAFMCLPGYQRVRSPH